MAINHELEALFERMAQIMEIRSENPFKCLAFHKVARVLKDLSIDIKKAVEEDTLKDIQGIGEHSRRIIEQYVREGQCADYAELTASVPSGLVPMLEIPSLGPKTIALFWKERGITSVEQLAEAIDSGKLAGIKGIGDKKLAAIKQGIELRAKSAGRLGIAEALPIAQAMREQLRKIKGVLQAEFAGSLRRGRETVGDVDLLCAVEKQSDGERISAEFVKFPQVERVLGQGGTKASILTAAGLQVDLRIIPSASFGAALLYFTGSKEHNIRLRSRALDRKMTLNEWGLYRIEGDGKKVKPEARSGGRVEKETGEAPKAVPIASATEQDVYRALDLEFIEPELREDRGEIDAGESGKLPRLLTLKSIRGDLHMHTTASDGANSIEEMAQAAKARSYEYIAITDHSKSSAIANGLSVERLLKHIEAIRKADAKMRGIRILAGCEVDILVDGRLDYEDEILKQLDIVIASPHVSLKQDEKKATQRLLRAIDNRYVNVIGHPTGRLIGGREGLPLDFAAVFSAAAKAGVALEINSGWPRLDLNDVHSRAAVAAGCRLAIDTDAHSIEGLDEIGWGITVARRAWVQPQDVINCGSFDELKAFLAKKR